jgi:CubicO group peptidase (beta-lactamase class C family)
MQRALIFTIGILALVQSHAGPTFSTIQPDSRLLPVRRQIEAAINKESAASISIAVLHEGRIVWVEAFGWSNRERRIPATPSTTYPIGSIAKPFTSTGLMVLAQRGLVHLDHAANEYLHHARIEGRAADANLATLRLILQHRAGLAEQNRFYVEGETRKRPSLDETIGRYAIVAQPPDLEHRYSNLGYGIIERVIEEASDQPFARFMAREVFEPLDLKSTRVGPNSQTDATLYGPNLQPIAHYDFDNRGAGFMYSAALDVARFGASHLKERLDGQRAILADAWIERMVTDNRSTGTVNGFWGLDWFYGLGWGGREESEFGHRWYGHEGGAPGVSSILQQQLKSQIQMRRVRRQSA